MEFTQMLRNNHEERKFVFPARIRVDIDGLKGKGGKIIPIYPQPPLIE